MATSRISELNMTTSVQPSELQWTAVPIGCELESARTTGLFYRWDGMAALSRLLAWLGCHHKPLSSMYSQKSNR